MSPLEQNIERFEIEGDLRTKTKDELITLCLEFLDICNQQAKLLEETAKQLAIQ